MGPVDYTHQTYFLTTFLILRRLNRVGFFYLGQSNILLILLYHTVQSQNGLFIHH